MIGRLQEIVIDCAEPPKLARFWVTVVGGEAVDREPDWSYVDPPGGPLRLAFQAVPESKQGKNRLHLDVEVTDIDAARERLCGEGATAVADMQTDAHGRFQVMRDPGGNEFCLVAD
jgi:predicted enzyme related to lactoylglutathione lyase